MRSHFLAKAYTDGLSWPLRPRLSYYPGEMLETLELNDISKILASIRQSISDANTAFDRGTDIDWRVETAFVKMRIFLEAAGFVEALKGVQRMEEEAKKNWSANEFVDEVGEHFLVWPGKLFQYVRAIETVLGTSGATTVSKDVVEILRATQYSITDTNCFPSLPINENDVHTRIEAVLRCVFPDLLHKPPISKQIKCFQPDTGLPNVGTLIEYKFMANHGDEKKIADEILADSRGYLSGDWKAYIYVIYETKRIKPESQWKQLLRECGVKQAEVVVISGEQPAHVKHPHRRLRRLRSKTKT